MTTKEKNILIYSGIGLVVVGIYLSTRKPTSTLGAALANPNANINKDGSKKKPIVSQNGVPSTVVDAAGDYIENSDNSTLYNAKGDVIGNINTSYGMFVDANGNIIAASDGTPVVFNVSNNTYTEPDGTVYNIDGSVNTPAKSSGNWFTNLFSTVF